MRRWFAASFVAEEMRKCLVYGKRQLCLVLPFIIRNLNAVDYRCGLPRLEVVVKSGTESTGMDIVEWAKRVEELGAGEILLTSKDADGTREGYDLEMTKAVAEAVTIPVVASGGAGKLEHLYEAVTIGKAAAVLAASIFHFGEISIPQAKKYLKERGIPVRI